MKDYWMLLVILVALVFGSCSPLPATKQNASTLTPNHSQSPNSTTQVPPDDSSGNAVAPINTLDFSEITPSPADANPFVRLVEEDLANRLKINPDQIQFLKITEIDWQDIRQGCTTTPDQTLTKGRSSGYRIWLEANGKNYVYHVGLDNSIFLCPD